MDDSVVAGKIRRWGFAYHSAQDYEWAGGIGGNIIQFEGNIQTLDSCSGILNDDRQKIVTRPFAGGFTDESKLKSLLQDFKLTTTVNELGATLADVSLCLAHTISSKYGTVICSMFTPKHIEDNVHALSRFRNDPKMIEVVSTIIQNRLHLASKTEFHIQ